MKNVLTIKCERCTIIKVEVGGSADFTMNSGGDVLAS